MKSNQKTPATQPLAPHLEEIARAIRKQVDGKRGGFYAADTVVRRKVSRLATLAGTRRLVKPSATFRRAMLELQGKELPLASQRREVTTTVAVIARWLNLTGLLPEPEPKQRQPPKRIKGVRRIKVGGNWLEGYGVEMNDRLLVAMTGDVRQGELGYFEFREVYDTGTSYYHRSFFFLTKRGSDCSKYEAQAGVCLRSHVNKCDGRHVGAEGQGITHSSFNITTTKSAIFFGRVVGAERDGRAVDITLSVRPYDEREGVTTSLGPTPEPERPERPKANQPTMADLRERLSQLEQWGDITDCTERFKLEKQIYDLEREQNADYWPDVIGEGGA